MHYPSDTTKKERRNLLATGFIGIIVAQIRVYPNEIELIGLKFQSPDLPFIAIGALCAATIYFLIKFGSSCLYERSNVETESLSREIREGRTAMDIAHEEQTLNELLRDLVRQTKLLESQDQHEKLLLEGLQRKIEELSLIHI